MRWEDERYVRIYTRDTPDWLALGWEARAVFWETLRKCDRAGLLELGKSGARGLASLTGIPSDIVNRVLPALVEDGCLAWSGTKLVVKNFMQAQEAAQSDRRRKDESRARALDEAMSRIVTQPQVSVTNRDDLSESVTLGGKSVTPCRAVPCLINTPDSGDRRRIQYSDCFSTAWKLYGRKDEKERAFVEWLKQAKEAGGEEKLLELVSAALKWQGPMWQVDGWKFAKYFERYLKARKWEDEPSAGQRAMTMDEMRKAHGGVHT